MPSLNAARANLRQVGFAAHSVSDRIVQRLVSTFAFAELLRKSGK
jgi:hypothetical protein